MDGSDIAKLVAKKRRNESSDDNEPLDELKLKKRKISNTIMTDAKELGRLKIFDKEYFEKVAIYLQNQKAENSIDMDIYKQKFEGPEKDWQDSQGGRRRIGKDHTLQAAFEHAQHLVSTYTEPTQQLNLAALSFFNNFLRYCLNLKPTKHGSGERESDEQSNFRKSLLQSYKAKHPSLQNQVWDSVNSRYVHAEEMVASHLFGWRSTKQNIIQIFGDGCKNELFSDKNGLLLPKIVEAALDKCALIIVPNVDNFEDKNEILRWESSHPREYKIKILDWKSASVKKEIPDKHDEHGRNLLVEDLDNCKLQFLSDHRPRARYVYWRYMIAMFHEILSTPARRGTDKMEKFYSHTRRHAWPTLRGSQIRNVHWKVFSDVLGERLPPFETTSEEPTVNIDLPASVATDIFGEHMKAFSTLVPKHKAKAWERILANVEDSEDEEAIRKLTLAENSDSDESD